MLDENQLIKPATLWISIGLGVLSDWFFYGKPPGLSVLVLVCVLYGLFLYSHRKIIRVRLNFSWLIGLAVLGLSATFALFSNELFRAINYLLIPLLLTIQITLLCGGSLHKWHSLGLVGDSLKNTLPRVVNRYPVLGATLKGLYLKRPALHGDHPMRRVILGLAFSLPFVVVILVLLSSADAIFGDGLEAILSELNEIDIPQTLLRLGIITCVSAYVFGYISNMRLRRQSGHSPTQPPRESRDTQAGWHPVTVSTVLIVLNVIYVVFVVVQVAYLFSGDYVQLPEGISYSEYAREGFFELLVVTMINLSLLLVCIRKTDRAPVRWFQLIRILLALLIMCSAVILVSSHLRLEMYEEAYGFTRLRFLSHAFMGFLLVLFGASLLQVWVERLFLYKAVTVCGLWFYVMMNYLNMDAVIAGHNVERYYHNGDFSCL